MLRLTFLHAGQVVAQFVPGEGEFVIGSGELCDISLQDASVSRRHARINQDGSGAWIEDLDSKNGLIVGGEAVRRVRLRPGMVLQLGRSSVRVEDVPVDDAEPALSFEGLASPVSNAHRGATATAPGPRASSALRVLELVRAIERGRASGWIGDSRRLVLAEAATALGARSLVLWSRSGRAPSFELVLSLGVAARPEDRDQLQRLALRLADPGVRSQGNLLVGGDPLRGHYLGAILDPDTPFTDWRFAAFDHLAREILGLPETEMALETASDVALRLPPGYVLGPSAAAGRLREDLGRAVRHRGTVVLIVGPAGSGKDDLARAIHDSRPQTCAERLVPINCTAIPPDLIEAQLFGVRKGVATGVDAQRGLFVEIGAGTVFLDEIGDASPELQAKLLRVLENGDVFAVGASSPVKSKARVVAATNRDLRRLVEEGRFREDLRQRLSGCVIEVPALAERMDDLEELVTSMVGRHSATYGKAIRGISQGALDRLRVTAARCQVRELSQQIEAAVRDCPPGGHLEARNFPPATDPAPLAGEAAAPRAIAAGDSARSTAQAGLSDMAPVTLRDEAEQLMRRRVATALAEHRGNVSATARALGISRDSVYKYK